MPIPFPEMNPSNFLESNIEDVLKQIEFRQGFLNNHLGFHSYNNSYVNALIYVRFDYEFDHALQRNIDTLLIFLFDLIIESIIIRGALVTLG